jgi:hypothetical protein
MLADKAGVTRLGAGDRTGLDEWRPPGSPDMLNMDIPHPDHSCCRAAVIPSSTWSYLRVCTKTVAVRFL